MYTRRRALAAVGGIVGLSGCVGFIRGEESLVLEAEVAEVEDTVAEEKGYELDEIETEVVVEELSAAGETREVEARNQVATYEKRMELPVIGDAKTGVFATISTPAVEFAGRTFNPVADYDNEELMDLLASNYDKIDAEERVEDDTVTVLGSDTEVTKFDGTATYEDRELDVYAHVGAVRNADDFVVVFGVYPQRFDDEESNVLELMENLRHPA